MVQAAERLEDQVARRLDEGRVAGRQEEIVGEHLLAHAQLRLGLVEVEVDVEALDELRDRVAVVVGLLLDDLDEVLDDVLAALAVDDDAHREVAQQVRCQRLDRVQVVRVQEEPVDEVVLALRVVEEHEE